MRRKVSKETKPPGGKGGGEDGALRKLHSIKEKYRKKTIGGGRIPLIIELVYCNRHRNRNRNRETSDPTYQMNKMSYLTYEASLIFSVFIFLGYGRLIILVRRRFNPIRQANETSYLVQGLANLFSIHIFIIL